ncbi:unnamed protein product [Dovyalis caffra]|uniref:Uncharacterized protein n=1 Tax=Dovyalis caffra TaxID=77055 RepID=A0AAV1SAJ8_9ROSI|nr:unnamed protein product [Dovyalis caffra]
MSTNLYLSALLGEHHKIGPFMPVLPRTYRLLNQVASLPHHIAHRPHPPLPPTFVRPPPPTLHLCLMLSSSSLSSHHTSHCPPHPTSTVELLILRELNSLSCRAFHLRARSLLKTRLLPAPIRSAGKSRKANVRLRARNLVQSKEPNPMNKEGQQKPNPIPSDTVNLLVIDVECGKPFDIYHFRSAFGNCYQLSRC